MYHHPDKSLGERTVHLRIRREAAGLMHFIAQIRWNGSNEGIGPTFRTAVLHGGTHAARDGNISWEPPGW